MNLPIMNTNTRYKPWQADLGEFDFKEIFKSIFILAFDYTRTIVSSLTDHHISVSGDCAAIPKCEDPLGISHLIKCPIPLIITVTVLSYSTSVVVGTI